MKKIEKLLKNVIGNLFIVFNHKFKVSKRILKSAQNHAQWRLYKVGHHIIISQKKKILGRSIQ